VDCRGKRKKGGTEKKKKKEGGAHCKLASGASKSRWVVSHVAAVKVEESERSEREISKKQDPPTNQFFTTDEGKGIRKRRNIGGGPVMASPRLRGGSIQEITN